MADYLEEVALDVCTDGDLLFNGTELFRVNENKSTIGCFIQVVWASKRSVCKVGDVARSSDKKLYFFNKDKLDWLNRLILKFKELETRGLLSAVLR